MLPQPRGRLLAIAELSAGLAAVLDGAEPKLTPGRRRGRLVSLDGICGELERWASAGAAGATLAGWRRRRSGWATWWWKRE